MKQPAASPLAVFWLALVLCTLTVLLGHDLSESYRREFEIQERAQTSLGMVIERHISTTIEKADVILLEAAHAYAPRMSQVSDDAQLRDANRDLLRREKVLPEAQVKSLRVIGADGKVIFSAGDTAEVPKINVGDRAYFRQQRDRRDAGLVISEPILSRFTGKWLFTLSRRIQDADGRFLGVAQTAIRAEYFQSGFQSIDNGARGTITLFHLDGAAEQLRLIARHPPLPDLLGKPVNLPAIHQARAQGLSVGTYQATSEFDGVDRQYVFRKFAQLPMLVVIGVPHSDILREWHHKAVLYAASLLLLGAELLWFAVQQRKAAVQARRHLRRQYDGLLLDLSRSTHAENGRIQESLQEVARTVARALDADVAIRLLEGETLHCRVAVLDGQVALVQDFAGVDLSKLEEVRAALMSRRSVSTGEIPWPDAVHGASAADTRPAAVTEVPIRQGQRLLGVVSVRRRAARAEGADEEEAFVASVGEQVAHALAANEHWLSVRHLHLVDRVMHAAPIAIAVCDAQRRVLFVNEAHEALSGHAPHEVVGQTLDLQVSHHLSHEQLQDIEERLATTGDWSGEVHDVCKDGSLQPRHLILKRLVNDEGQTTHFIRLAADISREYEQRRQIEHLAYHDNLTGLANRVLFSDRLQSALCRAQRAGRRVALYFIDVDRFKTVNDTFGHEVGDELLKVIARRLKSCLRDSDTLCRSGGDEFLLICEEFGDTSHLAAIGERLQTAVAEPLRLAGQEFTPSISIGVAIAPDDADNGSDLAKNADIAMYQAKEQGRRCMRFFTDELNNRTRHRHQIEMDLRRALAAGEELFMVYQPKVCVTDRVVVGMEALVRWPPAPGKFIAPDQFIAIAEDTQLIEPLGQWIINDVLAQVRRWRGTPLEGVPVAINISPLQLKQPDFLDRLVEACDRHGVVPQLVELEITEGVFIGDLDEALVQLRRIKDLGFRLALDDFGTGYSSFSYLASLPLDVLKVDRSFTRTIGSSDQATAVLTAIIAISEALQLELVAEGVETADQVQWLRHAGDCIAQGYHYFRPARPAELLEAVDAAIRSGAILSDRVLEASGV